MVQRKTIESEGSEEAARPQTPFVLWVHDGPVCVTILDEPRRLPVSACRCGGCHASAQPDLAANFLPD